MAEVAARPPPRRRWPRIVLPGTEAELLAAGVDPASVHPRPGERRLMIPDRDARFDPGPEGRC